MSGGLGRAMHKLHLWITVETRRRLVATVHALRDVEVYGKQKPRTGLVTEEALKRELARLERAHHGGKRYPVRDGQRTPAGRPKGGA